MQNQRVNFKTIIKDFLNAFNVERGIIPTLRDLLMRPEMVIHHYIEKRQLIKIHKEKYYMPGRFFVTILAAISVFSFFFGENILNPEMMLDIFNPDEAKKKMETSMQLFDQYMMLAVFLTSIIPYALSTKLLFIKQKQFTLAMHFIMNIYFSMFVLLSYPLILLFVSSGIHYIIFTLLILIIYYGHALKRVFNLSFSRTILSMILLPIIVFVIIAIPALLYGFASAYFAHNPF